MKFKRILAALLVFSMVLPVFSGCTKKEDSGQQNTSGTNHVEVLKIGTTYKNDGYSAMNSESAYGRLNYQSFSQLSLWRFDEEGKLTGDGSFFKNWEISDDNTQLTLHFDPLGKLKWHDGQPVTIEDVLFTFDYYKQQNKTLFLKIASIEKVSDTSIRLNFDDSYAFGFMNEATLSYYLLPKHIWESVKESDKYTEANAAIGCGPYQFVSEDKDAQTSYYEAVADYPLGELTVDKVELKSYDKQDALLMAMQNGEIDAMYGYSASLDTTLLPTIEADENIDKGESLNTATYQIVFGFNKNPTKDLAFRKAARYALDYELLAQSI
ncbi:MAG: ABC transporter substrate-binding protein, partial [Eubacterium sp.]